MTRPAGARVTIEGDTVVRPAGWWTTTVHALLVHLRGRGVRAAPEPIEVGDGLERLRFIPGDAGADCWAHQADEAGVRSAARLLRQVHDVTAGWQPPAGSSWALSAGPAGFGGPRVICHGDPGPWNMVWRGPSVVGLIDWDLAHPGDAIEDVAYALEWFAPFRSDEDAGRWLGFRGPPDRRHRIEIFAEAYGLDGTGGLVEAVVRRQLLTIRHVTELAELGVDPQRRWVKEGLLEDLARRVEWSRTHGHLLR